MNRRIAPVLLASILSLLTGCSLLKVELQTETTPLDQREMNTRIRIQEFAKEFSRAVETGADSILASSADIEHQISAINWKINATQASRYSIFQTVPSVAAIDTWVLCRQMNDLFNSKMGAEYFGEWQPIAAETSMELDHHIERLAHNLVSPAVFNEAIEFVDGYCDTVRLHDLRFQRDPIYEAWNEYQGIPDSIAVQTVGSLSQVFDNATTQLSDIGMTVPKQSKWQLELLRKQFGEDTVALFTTMDSISSAINSIARLAENPEMLDTALIRLRMELVPLMVGMRDQWNYTMYVIGQERVAITDSLKVQSAAIMVGLDSLSTRVTERAVKQAMDGIPAVISQLTLLVIVLTVALLGVPFLLGLLIGRFSMRKKLS